jgi:hypothetical protein
MFAAGGDRILLSAVGDFPGFSVPDFCRSREAG